MKSIYYEKNIPKVLLTKFNAKHCKALLFSGLNAVKYDQHLPDPKLPGPAWLKIRNNCLRWLRARGALVKVGHHMCPTSYDETPIWWQELTVVGIDAHGMEHVNGKSITTFDYVQELIRDGKYKTGGFITHRFPLDEYKKAFRLMLKNPPELVKIVLDCRQEDE